MNFIGDLLSVESLRSNLHLRELYLTGNPCTEYQGYRDFVVGTLPQLAALDGKEITKSERIAACQKVKHLRGQILAQQDQHTIKRKKEKEAFKDKEFKRSQKKPGFDGRWYTDPQAHVTQPKGGLENEEDNGEKSREEEKEETEAYTPEYRLKSYKEDLERKLQETKEQE